MRAFCNKYRDQIILAIVTIIAMAVMAYLAPVKAATLPTTVTKTVGQTATVYWTAPTAYTDGTAIASSAVITYNVSEGPGAGGSCSGAAYAPIAAATGISALQFVPPAYTAPGDYCYVVTSTIAGATSSPSNAVLVSVMGPKPNPPAAGVK